MTQSKEKLWTASFISICVANFMLFFAFYLLLPILPLYLIENFQASKSLVGIILSSYTIAALLIRPMAGFLLDMFQRRPIYLLAYFLFSLCFIGYPLANFLNFFLSLRIVHGLCFGMVSTASNSFVIDIMPSSRRGEGLGYFGIANNLAMSIGPMISLFLHDYSSYQMIFFTSIASSLIGFVVVLTVKAKKTTIPTIKKYKEAIVLDRFFLIKGTHAGICLTLMGIPYGMLTTFIAIYGKEIGMYSGMGIFFTLMAIGLIFSRFFAGRMVDRGHLLKVITVGTIVCTVSIFVLPALKDLFLLQQNFSMILFYVVAVFLGLGYGMLFPAYNTLFVNLAPHNRRATASSTFLTTWDVGIGLGLIIGGKLGDTHGGLSLSFLTGGLIAFSSLVYFIKITAPHYKKNTIIT
ncbi:MAG: MFS transporter [Paludibacteraceae bacterium]|jgi:MFS family permease|nr:MFS transporter [Paludibacteraceae bacterium]OPZ03097.1 MAG: Bacillibactin exporter [Bacteroidetes bacterium ADurb.BinA395]HOF98866.1 MFS transporter [Paludibacteraceae bacterium]HOJ66148.1 MFS transporter [Paludibacteraceae bacterium]HOL28958.1 MFS transporter [Paludibacteraceae bacterium]